MKKKNQEVSETKAFTVLRSGYCIEKTIDGQVCSRKGDFGGFCWQHRKDRPCPKCCGYLTKQELKRKNIKVDIFCCEKCGYMGI